MPLRFSTSELASAAAQWQQWFQPAKSVVAFTGAGISTESGIPDFRSPGGVWATNRTIYFNEFQMSAEARFEYWRQKAIAHRDFMIATPNITHRTLADWERSSRLRGVITQNIDGLHQEAGSKNVLELHGTARFIACLNCSWREPADQWVEQFEREQRVPDCPACGGLLKHATVSFGQSLPEDVLEAAVEWASECDLFLALGSSLVVEPAASLPRLARQAGAKLVIVNRDATPLDNLARMVVNAPLGEFFEAVARASAE